MLATHADPSPTATSAGRAPTWIGAPIAFEVAGSIRVTVSSDELVTQTDPSPAAIPPGAATCTLAGVTSPVPGSIRSTLPSPLATHTPPSPTATPSGPWPTGEGCPSGRPLRGSRRITRAPELSATHTPPSPTAIAVGVPPTRTAGSGLEVAGKVLAGSSLPPPQPARAGMPIAIAADRKAGTAVDPNPPRRRTDGV